MATRRVHRTPCSPGRRHPALALVLATLILPAVVHADGERFDLASAVASAVIRSAGVQTARAEVSAAVAQVGAAQAAELPQGGLVAQVDRATGNVVPGATFAMPGIPAVSGPPRGREFDAGAWGSALGTWVSWDVTDLARRMALVDAALAEQSQARAGLDARQLEAAYRAADAFVAAADSAALVRALQASVERARVFARVVHALADQQLRPGADAARADAEVALALTQVARAQQAQAVHLAVLAEAVGLPGRTIEIEVDSALPVQSLTPVAVQRPRDPRLVVADAAVQSAQQRERAVGLEYLPRLDLVAAVWLRGSGYFPGGANLGDAQGLLPDTPNWAAGAVLSWSVFDLFVVRARERAAHAQVALADARRRELVDTLAGQLAAARAVLEGATQIAQQTEPALVAARAAEEQARTRYQAGLATAVEVAEAQRLLAQAEAEDVEARLGVRRAQLLLARALGDLSIIVPIGTGTGGH